MIKPVFTAGLPGKPIATSPAQAMTAEAKRALRRCIATFTGEAIGEGGEDVRKIMRMVKKYVDVRVAAARQSWEAERAALTDAKDTAVAMYNSCLTARLALEDERAALLRRIKNYKSVLTDVNNLVSPALAEVYLVTVPDDEIGENSRGEEE